MTRFATTLAALLLAALPSAAQLCPGQNFWHEDDLPANPGGALAISIIQGVCEGEAVAQVFNLNGAGTQKIEKVSVGFGHTLGASGFNAVVNVEIYDGITWAGNTPILGPKVFDLGADQATSMQVISTGINEIDLSPFNIEVGNGAGDAFVVAFRMDINPNGTCAGGFSANFFTDFSGGVGCQTTPKTSLLDVSGQGWGDIATSTVSGFPLCPLFINGNWAIRACTTTTGGTGSFIDVGNSLTGIFAPSLTGTGSLAGGGAFTLTFAGMPPLSTGYTFVDGVAINAPFKGGVLVPGTTILIVFPTPSTAFGTVDFPGVMPAGLPSGVSIWVQGWVLDAGGPAGASASNGLQLVTP